MRYFRIALRVCISVLFCGNVALAQTGVNVPPDMVTDRPDQTESAFVVPESFFQAEIGWQFSRSDADSERIDKHQFPATLIRLGILSRAELRLGWEGGLWERGDGGVDPVLLGGVGDTGVGTKVSLWKESGWIPETAVLLGLVLPTGQEGFSTERFDPSLRLAMSNQLTERLGLGYNVAIDWESFLEVAGDRDTRPSFTYTAALGIGLTGRSSIFVEVFGRAPLHASGSSRISFDSGLTYLVLGNFQLDLAAGAGLSSEAPDWFVGAGFSFRLPR